MIWLSLAFSGVALGSIAALSGIGLIITYRATGVFNLAHGGIAMMAAYLLWQCTVDWHLTMWVGAPVALAFGPLFGVLVDLVVFRPMQRRGASPAELLVATLCILLILIGVAVVVWGLEGRSAPALVPTTSVRFPGGARLGVNTLVQLLIVAAVTAGLALLTTRTRLGTQIRAVVDRRELAEMSAVDADRISMMAWAAGSGFAGLTGVLLAPGGFLNPELLTLVVLETFAIPVLARLYSLPRAIAAGVAIGVAESELAQLHPVSVAVADIVQSLQSNLLVVALFVALLVLRTLNETGGADAGTTTVFASRRTAELSTWEQWRLVLFGVVFLGAPLLFSVSNLRSAERVPALAVIFVSLVAVSGYSGQISLGQAGYAGLGALVAAKLQQGQLFYLPPLPWLPAVALGMVVAGGVGFLTGWPAIRRRGLFLALTTFSVGVVVSRFVFNEPFFTDGVHVTRPHLLGISFDADRSYYLLELVCLGLALLVVRNLRSGRLGRALVAMRDNEDGARSVGIDISLLKMFIFAVSSALAGLGGVLLAGTGRAFDATAFDPLIGLFWFTAVIVFGADSAFGAVLAAGFAVAVDLATGQLYAYTVAVGLIGLLLLPGTPGGVVSWLRDTWARVQQPQGLLRSYALAVPPPRPPARLSATGRAVAARLVRR